MTYRVRPSIVATVADYGGSFAAHMLEAVGAFDPPELSDVWACDETWLSMLVSLRDFHLAVLLAHRNSMSFQMSSVFGCASSGRGALFPYWSKLHLQI